MEVRQQQELLLLEVEGSVAKYISQEESRNFSFNSSSSSNITKVSFLTVGVNPTIQGGEAMDPQSRARRRYVQGMMKHSWDGYSAHAWGKNEVRPVSKSANSGSVFEDSDMGDYSES